MPCIAPRTLVTAAVSALLTLPLLALPAHLRTNVQTRPLGIDTSHPILSWQESSLRPG